MIVATYNVHRCIGVDRRHDPDRVAAVIRELDADVVGLQEVDAQPEREDGLDQVAYLANATGFVGIAGPTLRRHHGQFGNALLTRRPVLGVRMLDLSVLGREPRGAIDADLAVEGAACRVVVTHLGLSGRERRRQVATLLAALAAPAPSGTTVVIGDLNEWLGVGRVLRRLPVGFTGRAAASFPSWFPVLSLDGVLVRPAAALTGLRAHRTQLARVASDHLPVLAEVHGGGP